MWEDDLLKPSKNSSSFETGYDLDDFKAFLLISATVLDELKPTLKPTIPPIMATPPTAVTVIQTSGYSNAVKYLLGPTSSYSNPWTFDVFLGVIIISPFSSS